jgi:hypothetical protein
MLGPSHPSKLDVNRHTFFTRMEASNLVVVMTRDNSATAHMGTQTRQSKLTYPMMSKYSDSLPDQALRVSSSQLIRMCSMVRDKILNFS